MDGQRNATKFLVEIIFAKCRFILHRPPTQHCELHRGQWRKVHLTSLDASVEGGTMPQEKEGNILY